MCFTTSFGVDSSIFRVFLCLFGSLCIFYPCVAVDLIGYRLEIFPSLLSSHHIYCYCYFYRMDSQSLITFVGAACAAIRTNVSYSDTRLWNDTIPNGLYILVSSSKTCLIPLQYLPYVYIFLNLPQNP